MQGLAAISPSLSFLHRMFVAQQIASSNLLLLVTDATCDCSIFPPVLLDAKEVKYILLLCAFGLRAGEGGKPAPLAVPMEKSVECTACLWDSRRQCGGESSAAAGPPAYTSAIPSHWSFLVVFLLLEASQPTPLQHAAGRLLPFPNLPCSDQGHAEAPIGLHPIAVCCNCASSQCPCP